jgi:hypothetical protein
VYIKVGKEKTSFGIHKDFLCSQSPYFKAAFNGGFEEAATGELYLEAANSATFGLSSNGCIRRRSMGYLASP